MRNIINNIIRVSLITVLAVIVAVTANAQGNPGGPGSNGSGIFGNGDPVGGGSPAVPFDGGMSLMLAASGIGYAAKKLKGKK